ncbi:MAG: spermidine synthase [Deltaproteobacteria bacterium]|nr:MAG: spermidine synthase [Deltaproteobacteria bacterium]
MLDTPFPAGVISLDVIDPKLLEKENVFYEEHDSSYGAVFVYEEHLASIRSPYQQIDVIRTKEHGKMLFIDHYMMFTEDSEFVYHEMMAHVPLAAHREAQRVLVIGGGDGGVVREVLKYQRVKKVTLVEIDKTVIEVCRRHFPEMTGSLEDPRVEVVIGDGVKYVKEVPPGSYDVIIVDSTDPYGVAELLISPEFFEGCRRTLGDCGLMIQQMASPFFTPDVFVKGFHNMMRVFPHVAPVLVPAPFYVSSDWALGLASSSDKFFKKELPEGWWEPPGRLKYYNPEVHRASFVLPNFVKDLMEMASRTPVLERKPWL